MKTILVIEDNENMLRMVNDLLSRSGYQVLTATDGVEGMKVTIRQSRIWCSPTSSCPTRKAWKWSWN
jgi:CheY-like chemotaxis protein